MKVRVIFEFVIMYYIDDSKKYHFFQDTPEEFDIQFRCLQYALFGCCFFQLAGSFAFLTMSTYVLDDKSAADAFVAENSQITESNANIEVITNASDDDDSAPIVAQIQGQDVEEHQ